MNDGMKSLSRADGLQARAWSRFDRSPWVFLVPFLLFEVVVVAYHFLSGWINRSLTTPMAELVPAAESLHEVPVWAVPGLAIMLFVSSVVWLLTLFNGLRLIWLSMSWRPPRWQSGALAFTLCYAATMLWWMKNDVVPRVTWTTDVLVALHLKGHFLSNLYGYGKAAGFLTGAVAVFSICFSVSYERSGDPAIDTAFARAQQWRVKCVAWLLAAVSALGLIRAIFVNQAGLAMVGDHGFGELPIRLWLNIAFDGAYYASMIAFTFIPARSIIRWRLSPSDADAEKPGWKVPALIRKGVGKGIARAIEWAAFGILTSAAVAAIGWLVAIWQAAGR